jgi:ribosomal protein S18 acetylase RimI-like enzyme
LEQSKISLGGAGMQEDGRIEIRHAVVGDAAAIAQVHLRAHRETYVPLVGASNYNPPDGQARLAQWTAALAADGIAFVAADGGRLVGFAHAKGETITTLYILAGYHRRGAGAGLLARLCQSLAERGIAKAHFAVFAPNAGAISFYESQGAHAVGSVMVEELGITYEDRLFEIATGAT